MTVYGMAAAYALTRALQAAGPDPTRQSVVAAVSHGAVNLAGPGLVPLDDSPLSHDGGRFVAAPDPLVLAEDFSFVLEQVPGGFVMLGACPPGVDSASAPYNHSPEAVFDDGVLADGTAIYAGLALRRLAAG
jgi:hypothetical protein